MNFHLNCDVGEGFNNEAEILPNISSCNIACGGHAGDAKTMESIILLAKKHNLEVGAHPSYPDKENFGRQVIDIPKSVLKNSIRSQINNLIKLLNKHQMSLNHVKPHGALYNFACSDINTATIIIETLKELKTRPKLYAPYNSIIANVALEAKIKVVFEAFADRNYNDDLSLVSRTNPLALITNPKQVLTHIERIQKEQLVKTISGKFIPIKANTFCIHSDTPSAVELIKNIAITADA